MAEQKDNVVYKGEDGREYINIKGKTLLVSGYREIRGKMVPVIKLSPSDVTVTKHPDGRQDVTIRPPALSVGGIAHTPKGMKNG